MIRMPCYTDAVTLTYLSNVGIFTFDPVGLSGTLDKVEGGIGLLKDVLPEVVVLPLVEAELGLQGTDLCLELLDLAGGGVHGLLLDFIGTYLLCIGR